MPSEIRRSFAICHQHRKPPRKRDRNRYRKPSVIATKFVPICQCSCEAVPLSGMPMCWCRCAGVQVQPQQLESPHRVQPQPQESPHRVQPSADVLVPIVVGRRPRLPKERTSDEAYSNTCQGHAASPPSAALRQRSGPGSLSGSKPKNLASRPNMQPQQPPSAASTTRIAAASCKCRCAGAADNAAILI